LVTAQNKRRQASTIERVISLSGQLLETTRLKSNPNSLISNRAAVNRLIDKLERAGFQSSESPWSNPIWKNVPKRYIAEFLRDFDVHPLNVAFQTGDLSRYLEDTRDPKLATWDVVIPGGSGDSLTVGKTTIRTAKRHIVVANGMLLVGKKARVGSRGSEKEGLESDAVQDIEKEFARSNPGKSISDRTYRIARPRPLLLIHIISPNDQSVQTASREIIALGLSFPSFDDADIAQRVLYRVNLIEWRSILEEEIDDDIQEEEDVR